MGLAVQGRISMKPRTDLRPDSGMHKKDRRDYELDRNLDRVVQSASRKTSKALSGVFKRGIAEIRKPTKDA
jgi:hypothetical protein